MVHLIDILANALTTYEHRAHNRSKVNQINKGEILKNMSCYSKVEIKICAYANAIHSNILILEQ